LARAEEGLIEEQEEHAMRKVRGYGLGLALVFGLSVVAAPLSVEQASAQIVIKGEECGINLLAVCSNTESETGEGGEATGGNGGRGGNGGFASVHDIANAVAAATSSVTVGDITTKDAFGHNIVVDARGAEDPSSIAGSFSDTGGRIFAPGGNAQAGTTGGNGLAADASGGDGGDGGNARGGNSGDSDVDSCNALLLGCFNRLI